MKIFSFTFLLCLTAFALSAQYCEWGGEPTPIFQSMTSYEINIETTGTDDLSVNPLVAVHLDVQHGWPGDFAAVLQSPSGLRYLIVGDGNNEEGGCGPSGGNGFDITIISGNFQPLTPGGLEYVNVCGGYCTGDFTVYCPYNSNFNNFFSATAAPGCDLNAFNHSGHTVSGQWELTLGCMCDDGAQYGFVLNGWGLEFENQSELNCIDNFCNEPVTVWPPTGEEVCTGQTNLIISDLPAESDGGSNYAWKFSDGSEFTTYNNSLYLPQIPAVEHLTAEVTQYNNDSGCAVRRQHISLYPKGCQWEMYEIPFGTEEEICFGGTVTAADNAPRSLTNGDYDITENCLNFSPTDFGCSEMIIYYTEEDLPQKTTCVFCVTPPEFAAPQIELTTNENTENGFNIYPNPAKEAVNLIWKNPAEREVQVVDFQGNIVQLKNITDSFLRIETADLPRGMYFVKAQTKGETEVRKVVLF